MPLRIQGQNKVWQGQDLEKCHKQGLEIVHIFCNEERLMVSKVTVVELLSGAGNDKFLHLNEHS